MILSGGFLFMKPLFIQYPKCSTCKRAIKFMNDNNIEYTERDIMEDNPNKEELRQWITDSGLPIKRFFNSSGIVYREMGLKDKLNDMTEDEMIELLASTGKLIRRPLMVSDKGIFVGFNEEMYETLI